MAFVFSCPGTQTITVSATDPEGDPLTYSADVLPAFMSFDPGTRTLTATTGELCPIATFYAKLSVTTGSGGTDAFIAAITYPTPGVLGLGRGIQDAAVIQSTTLAGGAILGIKLGATTMGTASLTVYDAAGRTIAFVRATSGEDLLWNGTDRAGRPVPTGIYLWQLRAGTENRRGKLVVVR